MGAQQDSLPTARPAPVGDVCSAQASVQYVAKDDLAPLIFLLPSPECWDTQVCPPSLFCDVLGMELREQ